MGENNTLTALKERNVQDVVVNTAQVEPVQQWERNATGLEEPIILPANVGQSNQKSTL